MGITLFVTGEIQYGKLHQFFSALKDYQAYRKRKGWVIPNVYSGISGPMNRVLMVYHYQSVSELESEEAKSNLDQEYATIAEKLAFREPSISYDLYREV